MKEATQLLNVGTLGSDDVATGVGQHTGVATSLGVEQVLKGVVAPLDPFRGHRRTNDDLQKSQVGTAALMDLTRGVEITRTQSGRDADTGASEPSA